MSALQGLSIALSAIILLSVTLIQRRSRHRLSNADKLLVFLLSGGLFSLGVNADIFNGILGFFSFTPGNSGRIIGLLVASVVVLYLLYFRTSAQSSALQQTIDRLVVELAKQRYQDKSDQATNAPICVVIPAYNEADNIGHVLKQMPKQVLGLDVDVVVVIDGGTDDTESIVQAHQMPTVTHIINRGGGAALQAGFDLALAQNAQIVVTLDADGQHLPEEMENLVQPILEGRADMVNGSRVLGVYESDQAIRALGVVLFNWLVSLLTWQRITDCSNAYRAIQADALAEVRPHLTQRQFHTTEMLIEMIKQNKRVIEVPITIQQRLSGESKKGPTLRYAFGFTRAIFSTWLR